MHALVEDTQDRKLFAPKNLTAETGKITPDEVAETAARLSPDELNAGAAKAGLPAGSSGLDILRAQFGAFNRRWKATEDGKVIELLPPRTINTDWQPAFPGQAEQVAQRLGGFTRDGEKFHGHCPGPLHQGTPGQANTDYLTLQDGVEGLLFSCVIKGCQKSDLRAALIAEGCGEFLPPVKKPTKKTVTAEPSLSARPGLQPAAVAGVTDPAVPLGFTLTRPDIAASSTNEAPKIEAAKSAAEFVAFVQRLKSQNWTLDNIEESLREPRFADYGYDLRFGRAELDAAYAQESVASKAGYNTNEKGQILKGEPYNMRLALGRLQVSLRHNDFSNENEIDGLSLAAFNGELTDAAVNRLRFWIGETQGFLPEIREFERVLNDVAFQNRYHPVRDYLAGVQWDGRPRLDTWPIDLAGAEDTPFNRAVGRIFLIAAVRRVRQPGVKFDNILVFESSEGKGKSTAASVLAVREEWFNDNLPLGAGSREVIEQTAGHWIIEFPELKGLKGQHGANIKSFLSRKKDIARLAWAKFVSKAGRQYVLIGTVNPDSTGYLFDDENRRWWPVKIVRFDLEKLRQDRDQLWAEAAHYETLGESIVLPEKLWPVAGEIQRERREPNAFFGNYNLDKSQSRYR